MATKLVRFVSPFGSPAWMQRARAEELLAEHDARWLRHQELQILSEEQRAVGPPYIQTAAQREADKKRPGGVR